MSVSEGTLLFGPLLCRPHFVICAWIPMHPVVFCLGVGVMSPYCRFYFLDGAFLQPLRGVGFVFLDPAYLEVLGIAAWGEAPVCIFIRICVFASLFLFVPPSNHCVELVLSFLDSALLGNPWISAWGLAPACTFIWVRIAHSPFEFFFRAGQKCVFASPWVLAPVCAFI